MPVPTGTATPWRQIEDPSQEGGSSVVLYFRPGEAVGPYELLAEQLRMDGAIRSLGPALGAASQTQPYFGWFGTDDDDNDVLCDQDGWTIDGRQIEEPRRCVLAAVDVTEA